MFNELIGWQISIWKRPRPGKYEHTTHGLTHRQKSPHLFATAKEVFHTHLPIEFQNDNAVFAKLNVSHRDQLFQMIYSWSGEKDYSRFILSQKYSDQNQSFKWCDLNQNICGLSYKCSKIVMTGNLYTYKDHSLYLHLLVVAVAWLEECLLLWPVANLINALL